MVEQKVSRDLVDSSCPVSVDLAVFTSDTVETISKQNFGVAKVFLCASHNHTAPSKPGKGAEYSNLKAFL